MEEYNDIAYKKAKSKVKEIRDFYYNLFAYCATLPFLIYINLRYTPDFQWFWFSIVGWGTGLVFQGMGAFGYIPFLGKNWEDRKLKEFMDKENNNKI